MLRASKLKMQVLPLSLVITHCTIGQDLGMFQSYCFNYLVQMMPVVQPDEEEASGSSAAPSPSVSTPSPTKSKVKNYYNNAMLQILWYYQYSNI